MSNNSDQPAYPSSIANNEWRGMSKRELIAAMAMQGLLAGLKALEYKGSKQIPPEEIARMATVSADALLSQLEKK